MDPKETNEMDDSYADGGYATMVSLPATPISTPDSTVTTVTSSAPVKNVTVYAQSINAVSYGDDDPIVAFDCVFSVGIVCPDTGSTKTYQVVKRIGVDRQKMAADAESTTPVSIVEARKPEEKGKFLTNTARLRALAGLK